MFHFGTIWYLLHNLARQPESDYINICLDNGNVKLSHNVHGFDYRTCGITQAFDWNLKESFVDILKSDQQHYHDLLTVAQDLQDELTRFNRMSIVLNSLVTFGYDMKDNITVFWIFNGYEMNYDLSDLTERTKMVYVVELEPYTWLILHDRDHNQVGIRLRNSSSTDEPVVEPKPTFELDKPSFFEKFRF